MTLVLPVLSPLSAQLPLTNFFLAYDQEVKWWFLKACYYLCVCEFNLDGRKV